MAQTLTTRNSSNRFERLRTELNRLPRSVVRSGPSALLDGVWRFELDADDRGLRDRWFVEHEFNETAMWPGLIEAHLAEQEAQQRLTHPWQDQVIAWYEREFSVPEGWLDNPHQEVQVTFGACSYETRVWLNGHPLTTVEGEEVHLDSYVSFSYELPRELLRPVNRLTVRIAHSMDAEIPRGKEESHVFKRGGIWYQTMSGPIGSIWLETVERNRLRSRLGIIATVEDRLVEFNLRTRIHDPGVYTVRLTVRRWGWKKVLASTDYTLTLEAGDKNQRLVMQVPGAGHWSPGQPRLYELTADLIGASGRASTIRARFGLRKIEARGRRIYLNNRPIYLDGILYQPHTASLDQMRRHLLAIQQLGCNLVRVHITGIDPRIYDLADEIGMLLWVEVPSPHSSTPRSRENHRALLKKMLVVIGSHPSVVIWSLYNEDWGAQDIATNPQTQQYISDTFNEMRVNHPQLLVVDNDGWNHVSREGRLESHLFTAHVYNADLEDWQRRLDGFVRGDIDGVAERPLTVGDPFFYQGQVPLVVSEWGGFGFNKYTGPAALESRTEQIRAFKRELRRRDIAGDVYTQATGVEEEQNGLIDPASGELLVPEGILDSTGFALWVHGQRGD